MRRFGRALRTTPTSGVARGEFNVLAILKRAERQRPRDLAEAEGTDASTMSRRLASMEERGLIARVPDPTDGRAHLVELTEAGIEAFRVEVGRRIGLITHHVNDWDAADISRLAELLERLNDSFDERLGGNLG